MELPVDKKGTRTGLHHLFDGKTHWQRGTSFCTERSLVIQSPVVVFSLFYVELLAWLLGKFWFLLVRER